MERITSAILAKSYSAHKKTSSRVNMTYLPVNSLSFLIVFTFESVHYCVKSYRIQQGPIQR